MVTAVTQGNVFPLHQLLDKAPETFCRSVWASLEQAGFDVTFELPNLQLASEVLESLPTSKWLGHAPEWEKLRAWLAWASHRGVLVDLSRHQVAASSASIHFGNGKLLPPMRDPNREHAIVWR